MTPVWQIFTARSRGTSEPDQCGRVRSRRIQLTCITACSGKEERKAGGEAAAQATRKAATEKAKEARAMPREARKAIGNANGGKGGWHNKWQGQANDQAGWTPGQKQTAWVGQQQQDKPQWQKDVTCHNCCKKGHIARDCRSTHMTEAETRTPVAQARPAWPRVLER